MTDWTFFVSIASNGDECLFYGDPTREPMWWDLVVRRPELDKRNMVVWRKLVFATTGEWPICDVPGCERVDRRHGNCSDKAAVGSSGDGGS